jgi:hypothetical protein
MAWIFNPFSGTFDFYVAGGAIPDGNFDYMSGSDIDFMDGNFIDFMSG